MKIIIKVGDKDKYYSCLPNIDFSMHEAKISRAVPRHLILGFNFIIYEA